jgi:hypothetical protein
MIESRAATRLGENVKLLTYVSIFYLPLAFCAGLWSINNSYSIPHFIITTAIALTNYLLVANLEAVVTFCTSLYRSARGPVIDRMQVDSEEKWSKKGIAFSSFRPEREKVEPLEWYILWFVFVELLRKIGALKLDKRKDPIPPAAGGNAPEETSEETTKNQEEAHSQVLGKGKGVAGGSTKGRESKMKESTPDSVFEIQSENTTVQLTPTSGIHFKRWFKKDKESEKGSGDPEKGG